MTKIEWDMVGAFLRTTLKRGVSVLLKAVESPSGQIGACLPGEMGPGLP